ncbi:Endolytic peptidoglycan transglycosylase RlpA [Koleobacter methoxysyntrophicus]|jgi:rare lipoprotein A|uniref:Probable endolytic peptidoglycan transglycosylase RlpA n=1 Tax=Koleobacter methoxysyntrophicus TaxID=2751313 RepID=A0A8A0RM22_9FIRM|nr:septal ring lytic transglycosylase RlpA family protein [Koleobacter methoxysyntrophicus]QSQ08942.1 Endolytic peptidoglycan transglycosylase RlpA [Koleobacter methoxysyntrophicus]
MFKGKRLLNIVAVLLAAVCILSFNVLDSLQTSVAFSYYPERIIETTNREFEAVASWYGPGFHGKRTASGEVYNQYELTAAHRTLPFGTRVRVTNTINNKSTVVRINDRGPYIPGRGLDISYGAAKEIGLLEAGIARVKIEILM